jgi:hypothetical protein
MVEAKARSRRRLLKSLLCGVPALAAGGILAHTGVVTAEGQKPSDFPGDAAKWREEFLAEARGEKGAARAVDIMEAPDPRP